MLKHLSFEAVDRNCVKIILHQLFKIDIGRASAMHHNIGIVASFDVDYDNGQNVVSKHLEARYTLSNYRNVVRDIKKMLSQAEELCKTVFVGDTFKDRMFRMMRLDLSGWQVIR